MLTGGVAAMVVVSTLLLVTVTIGGVPHWPTVALMACFMGCLGFIYSNAAMLATTEVRHAAGTGSAVLGFLQYGTGALAAPLVGLAGQHSAAPMGWTMFGAALAAAAALFLLTRGHVPVDEAEEAEQALAGSVAAE